MQATHAAATAGNATQGNATQSKEAAAALFPWLSRLIVGFVPIHECNETRHLATNTASALTLATANRHDTFGLVGRVASSDKAVATKRAMQPSVAAGSEHLQMEMAIPLVKRNRPHVEDCPATYCAVAVVVVPHSGR